jgi:hypothetical protein
MERSDIDRTAASDPTVDSADVPLEPGARKQAVRRTLQRTARNKSQFRRRAPLPRPVPPPPARCGHGATELRPPAACAVVPPATAVGMVLCYNRLHSARASLERSDLRTISNLPRTDARHHKGKNTAVVLRGWEGGTGRVGGWMGG